MQTQHIRGFLDAMQRRDAAGIAPHFAEDISLRSPLRAEPFTGRAYVSQVLATLQGVTDSMTIKDEFTSDRHAAAVFELQFGGTTLEAVDYITVDDEGLIRELTVTWRPLPAIMALQNRLAPIIGMPALKLTEA